MTAPDTSPDSGDERNQQPTVTKNHRDSEHSQEYALHGVRLWLAEHAKRTDANCNTKAAN